jgi:sugar fermentation stimulation protein A
MEYTKIVKAIFKERPNRFIAIANIDGKEETVHVKNTGRCRELLVKGATVFLEEGQNPNRKTKYDLVGVIKNGNLINMDSQAPNKVAIEFLKESNLFSKNAIIKGEVTYKSSRFDIFVTDGDRNAFIEVKGVTLENDGIAMFPDAPTERGIKHIRELISARDEGYESYILFVIQMKGIKEFTPNYSTHLEFGNTLKIANENGVKILAYDCIVTENSLKIDMPIAVRL